MAGDFGLKVTKYSNATPFLYRNILSPNGVSLLPGILTITIYRGEGFPQTDPEYYIFKRKLFNKHRSDVKSKVDPYCVVSYAGLRGETDHVEKCHDPHWNKEIKMTTCVSLKVE